MKPTLHLTLKPYTLYPTHTVDYETFIISPTCLHAIDLGDLCGANPITPPHRWGGGEMCVVHRMVPYTLHPTPGPCTLHPTPGPNTLHPTPGPYTQHPTPALHLALEFLVDLFPLKLQLLHKPGVGLGLGLGLGKMLGLGLGLGLR